MKVLTENQTISLLENNNSIARFGDGELRLALGISVGHQEAIPRLTEELKHILYAPTKCLVGIPYIDNSSPKAQTWRHYNTPKYQALFNNTKLYVSAFITRPDSAPWIDIPEYWQCIKNLWAHASSIITVSGSQKGFRLGEFYNKKSFHIQTLPEQAYQEIDAIEKKIIEICNLHPDSPVLLAAGATATVLAWRLAEKGIIAWDFGHLPMFMRRRGLLNG